MQDDISGARLLDADSPSPVKITTFQVTRSFLFMGLCFSLNHGCVTALLGLASANLGMFSQPRKNFLQMLTFFFTHVKLKKWIKDNQKIGGVNTPQEKASCGYGIFVFFAFCPSCFFFCLFLRR